MSAIEVMVDLETLGTTPNSVILSLGAVAFQGDNPKVQSFYAVLDIQNQIDVGRTISQDTLLWWMSRGEQARTAVFGKDRTPTAIVIMDFIAWYEEIKPSSVWAKSPSFDLVMLEDLFKMYGVKPPWKFWDHQDVRTILSAAHCDGVWKGEVPGFIAHHAGWDAHVQALQVIAARHKIRS